MYYGIWLFDGGETPVGGIWLCEIGLRQESAILAFKGKRAAMRRAAIHLGFPTYTEAKRKGWCEVRPLADRTRGADDG